ncbi:DUF6314 family protein [Streptomyces sp. NPDC001262]|uniref:DUF6314 family protein n=1 Tax=Streptomyces sp. NPDC001262 TaxID=3364552 RepID=UPI0036AAD72D
MNATVPGTAPAAVPTSHPVPDAVAYLAGHWSLDRTLIDLDTGSHGWFHGTAAFRPAADETHVLHTEDGELSWNGTVNRAGRTLRMLPGPDGTAAVMFADGRPFHHLDLRTGHWTARHPCGQDLYNGTYTVVSPDEWHLQWRTTGPAKNQELRSVYRRQ